MFYIVEAVVDKEAQFGYDAQLIMYARAQFVAYGLDVAFDIFEQLFTFFRGENAEVGGADAEIGLHACTCYAHHYAVHHSRLRLENKAQLFLQKSGDAVLSCFLHSRWGV